MAIHEMFCETETAAEVLFVCADEACGRRVVVGKSRPRLTVIDRGDFSASHVGSLGGVVVDGIEAA
ncbi:hypothetical protein BJ973_008614 [Actinoplanes tereljensis]|uniref:Uncharacterized protein n=1 Tax=Paractinoplanes tereljensis TaxID=571912 RepID=A0A919TRV0_9ACTN|nr:hypothetical protein [Actinoplanes tereljensis]GIF18427.1 hypothetical protein Ate02nite_11570 [Actinoplanes tereljensis]